MPALDVPSNGEAAVKAFSVYLERLLDHAESVKPTKEIDPAIRKSDLDGVYDDIYNVFAYLNGDPKNRKYAIVETAARKFFADFIAAGNIDLPSFVRVWNLFDILSIFSDNGHCDPPLLFWLIEELLDSQTIPSCRKVFDYLESRRERITANHFNSKKLVILRSCNDLLRRLSRAEDTPFCGRVFVFLFQVFPLGDKSSVNLRGEYHVENVTTYDAIPPKSNEDGDKMDVDAVAEGAKPESEGKEIEFDALYPVFWSLQGSFSQPKNLFDPDHFAKFKSGLEASLAAFQKINSKRQPHSSRHVDEARRGVKRKRDREDREDRGDKEDKEDELADTYNPKYLTSRDLFELETSDLTFRRHILLQSLIVMEFLLSLSPQAKKKLATTNTPNKSVTYSDHVLSEEDAAWATKMKHDITEHIKNSDDDGAYFFRMVDTILARDKNWVRWKVESCQSIERPGVSAEEFVGAKDGAQRAFAKIRRRGNSLMGSFSLDFLDEEDEEEALEKLKQPRRFALPELATFEKEIANEDLEIEMPDSDESKMLAEERKASKTWRALRIVRQTNLSLFDKIESDNDVSILFSQDAQNDGGDSDADDDAADGDEPVNRDSLPENTAPVVVVVAGAAAAAAAAPARELAASLMQRNPGVFGLVLQHTTEAAPEEPLGAGEKPAYHYVDRPTFNALLDGDKFLAFGEVGDVLYGTQKSLVDAVVATGKVPLVPMQYESMKWARDNDFAARYVLVQPSGETAAETSIDTKLFGKVVDAADAVDALEAYIYGLEKTDAAEAEAETETGDKKDDKTAPTAEKAEKAAEEDAMMTDAEVPATEKEGESQETETKEA